MEPILTTVGDLTGDEVLSVASDASLRAVAEVLAGADIGAATIEGDGRPMGIVSERDIVRAVASGADLDATTAADAGSTELVWADSESSLEEVAAEMMRRWVRHVLVETDGTLVGIVSARDLLGAVASDEPESS